LSGVRPPANNHGNRGRQPRNSDQSSATAWPRRPRRRPRLDQQRRRRPRVARQVAAGANRHRTPHRHAKTGGQRRDPRRRIVNLQHIELHGGQNVGNRGVVGRHEQSHPRRPAVMPCNQRRRLRGADIARRAGKKHQPDPVRAGLDRGVIRRRAVHAADFDPGHAMSAAMAAAAAATSGASVIGRPTTI
jgi:hypothetical protein